MPDTLVNDRANEIANGPSADSPSSGEIVAASRSKVFAGLFSLLVLLVVLSPITQHGSAAPNDNFPLSFYPMFSKHRRPVYKQAHFLGIDDTGNRVLLSYKVAGSGGLNQVRRQLNKMLREGTKEDIARLCKTAARRVARKNKTPYESIVTVRIVRGAYHLDDYFSKDHKAPLDEYVYAESRVERRRR